MIDTIQLVAIAEIYRSGKLLATGAFTDDGEPVLLREAQVIPPGTAFVASAEEAAQLLAAGGAALPGSEAGAHALRRARAELL